jgi:RNA polymerase sigma factor (TIGR02999 family)
MRRERPGQTLQATALVHEAYLRLVDQDVVWESRAHFFAIAAQAMRRVLVDHARRRRAAKRGGPLPAMSLDETVEWPAAQAVDVEELDEALDELARLDPQQSRIVELRFFGGLSIEETAQAVGASASTVKREWNSARTWLYRRLKQV